MEVSRSALVRGVFDPPRLPRPRLMAEVLDDLLGSGPRAFFDLGRSALHRALEGLKPSDTILIPELLCTEALEPIRSLGLRPAFYRLREDLAPEDEELSSESAAAVLMVDFFGFPAPIEPFEAYRSRTGARIIEDNAHGLLGSDENGRLLGTRADAGIFSFRKTLPVKSGAALVGGLALQMPSAPASFAEFRPARTESLKNRLRPVMANGGARWLPMITSAVRSARSVGVGRSDSTTGLGRPPILYREADFLRGALSLDLDAERERRRTLYSWILSELSAAERPVSRRLPVGTVPFTCAFYYEGPGEPPLAAKLRPLGLEVSRWPTLPREVEDCVQPRFRAVHIVRFLW